MKRDEAIRRLCALSTKVAEKHFKWGKPADCLCHEAPRGWGSHQFSDLVMEFIEEAVNKAMDNAA